MTKDQFIKERIAEMNKRFIRGEDGDGDLGRITYIDEEATPKDLEHFLTKAIEEAFNKGVVACEREIEDTYKDGIEKDILLGRLSQLKDL